MGGNFLPVGGNALPPGRGGVEEVGKMIGILGNLIDPATLALMVACAFLIAFLQNDARDFPRAFAALGQLFCARPDSDRDAARAAMLKVDHLAQLRGLPCTDRAVSSERVRAAHPFLAEAMRKLANCDRVDQFDQWAAQDLADRAQRHASARNVWISVADAAPALGMAGTIIGLIGMFASMDDPAAIGPAMALALLTTLYGVILANLVAAPIAARLSDLSVRELAWQRELADRMLAVARRENAPVRRASMRDVA